MSDYSDWLGLDISIITNLSCRVKYGRLEIMPWGLDLKLNKCYTAYMNKYVEKIFRKYKPNYAKLVKYGFTQEGDAYSYACDIVDNQFRLKIKICGSDIETEVIDLSTDEEYTLFLSDNAVGSFVGSVRNAYENALTDIAEKCFDKCVFKSEYTQAIIEYVNNTYGDELEFLWEKFDDNAIWRRRDNRKWYGVLLTVNKRKLGLDVDEKVEIIDLRTNTDNIDNIVDDVKIFRGYHMNKKHWITICLDGSVSVEEIEKLIDISYELANK